MTRVTVAHAEKHLSGLLARAINGEEIMIVESGRPLAKLVPVPSPTPNRGRPLDTARGKVAISPDFDAPLWWDRPRSRGSGDV